MSGTHFGETGLTRDGPAAMLVVYPLIVVGLSVLGAELTERFVRSDFALTRELRERELLAALAGGSWPARRPKQNLADLTQTATDLNLRFVDQGKAYPAPVAKIPKVTFIGAGYPDYPWLFATDGEYTAFAAVALGQFEAIEQHLIALRGDEQLALAVDGLGETFELGDVDLDTKPGTMGTFVACVLHRDGADIYILNLKELFPAAIQGRERRRRRF